jgi:hypothetical protein
LYKEWDEHVKQIIEEDKKKKPGLFTIVTNHVSEDLKPGEVIFTEETLKDHPQLQIVGFVGSIGRFYSNNSPR